MRRLMSPLWLLVLAVGFLATACTGAGGGFPTPSGSPTAPASPTPMSPAAALASPAPTATVLPTPSAGPGPKLAAAERPKQGAGLPDGFAPFAFRELGLAAGQVVNYELIGDASASYQCWNPRTTTFGKQNWTVAHPVTTMADLTPGPDGTIESVIRMRLPEPDPSSCSTGFKAVAYAGKVDHPRLTDNTNAVTLDLEPYQFTAN